VNKTETETIRNIIKRLREPRAGCSTPEPFGKTPENMPHDYELVSRIYINTWLVGPLELLVEEGRTISDLILACDMSRR